MTTLPVSFEDICAARTTLEGVAHRTPVFTSTTLDASTGARVYLKCDSFQRTGSFKIRGAFNACSNLDEAIRANGVLAYSSGNHAQAVALSARILGIRSVIVMPTDAPSVKLEATRGYGAEIIQYDRRETAREELAEQIQQERGLPVIPPYDHPHVIAGQGTAVMELLEDVPDLDIILIPCGGGGLLSGTAIAAREMAPNAVVIGVEPAAADDATRSFRSGVLHTVENPDTIADGARTPSLGRHTFPIVRALVDDMVTVSDHALIDAMKFLYQRMKLVAEPTGVLGVAALLTRAVQAEGKRVGVIVSGGNVAWPPDQT